MTQAVVACALAVAVLNALPGLLGVWIWYRGGAAPAAPAAAPAVAAVSEAAVPEAAAPEVAAPEVAAPDAADRASAGGSIRAFWVLLRVGQGSALVLAIVVGSLAAAGHYSSERLFYLYALLPLAIAFVAEQLRVASAQTILDQRNLPDAQAVGALPESEQHAIVAAIVTRETIIMALSALVVVFLALRAASTAHGF